MKSFNNSESTLSLWYKYNILSHQHYFLVFYENVLTYFPLLILTHIKFSNFFFFFNRYIYSTQWSGMEGLWSHRQETVCGGSDILIRSITTITNCSAEAIPVRCKSRSRKSVDYLYYYYFYVTSSNCYNIQT